MVFLSVERFIIVCLPLRAKSLCTRKKSIVAVCILPVVLFGLYSYHFVAWEIDANHMCNIKPYFNYLIGIVAPWITTVLYCYCPATILLILTTAVSVQLSRMKKRRAEMVTQGQSKANQEHKITIMVIVISILFIVLTTPVTAYYVVIHRAGQFVYQQGKIPLYETIVQVLGLSNHAVNFLLYSTTSLKFRQELRNTYPFRSDKVPDISLTNTTGASSKADGGEHIENHV